MQTYGQFCPVAKAMEVIGTRWTTLVLREVIGGASRFNDIQRGVPLMSRALLVQRLRDLEAAGLIASAERSRGHGYDYTPTDAGLALRPVLAALSVWGQTHTQTSLGPEDCDPGLFLWKLRQHTNPVHLPADRFTIEFNFRNLPRGWPAVMRWWLVAIPGEALDVCPKEPGFPVDVIVSADIASLIKTWLGYRGLPDAERAGEIEITGSGAARAALIRMLDLRNTHYHRDFYADHAH